jgi:hypothetical protein
MSMGASTGGTPRISVPDPAASYRPVSAMAVICFCLSLATPLAFAHYWFWGLPPFVFLLSLFVSRGLEQAKQEYAGQLLAKAAIFIALISGVGSITRYSIERAILTREARQVANQFLDDVLANRLKEAFALTLPPFRRANMETEYDQLIIRNGNNYRQFLAEPVIKELAGEALATEVTYVGVGEYSFKKGFQNVGMEYRFKVDNKGTYLLRILVSGAVSAEGEWQGRQWYVWPPRIELIATP